MDYVSNEHPTGGFFGGGYESAFQAIRLDSDKNQATGSDLGNYTISHAFRCGGGFEKNTPVYDSVLARTQRYALQDIASSILTEKETRINKKDGSSYETLVHRVGYCCKQRRDASKSIFVRYNEKRNKAHFDNLQRCGGIWTCAVCAHQITEGRRDELKIAMDNARAKGWFVYMVTFTNRHHVGDSLRDLLQGQEKAFKKMWARREQVQGVLKKLGYVGRIRATEVTYGDNGWHPHYHILFFFDHEINVQGLQSLFAYEWQRACIKSGMKAPSLDRGVDVKKGKAVDSALGDYLAKWGLEHEMTKGHTKKGKKNGLTPFDLLRQSVDNPKYRALFKQFADVFKGQRQLYWSDGLKALLSVANLTDEELAQETEKESIEIQEVATQIWRLILRYKFRGQYLRACELDYLDGGSRVYDLVMGYAVIEQERLNALDRERLRE